VDLVSHYLAGRFFDVLFIDGDHSPEGVSKDYKCYSSLVTPSGVIAFHDIHPDWRTTYGRSTNANSGEVPTLWGRIKQQEQSSCEFITNPGQDGYGIGIVIRS
jgi:hypothetical protein